MDRGLADAKLLCGGADGGLVFYDVKGQALRPFLHVLFQNAHSPLGTYPILCGKPEPVCAKKEMTLDCFRGFYSQGSLLFALII